MATIRIRERKRSGPVHEVYWRDGGAAAGDQESERFDDPDAAKAFMNLVTGYGNKWPPGWVKGRGFVQEEEAPAPAVDPAHMFETYSLNYVTLLTGVEGGTKRKYRRLVREGMVPWFRDKIIVDGPDAISEDDVKAWINALAAGTPAPHDPPDRKRKPYSAKTVRDHHGLLSAILGSATKGQNPLRRYNPCSDTKLPRKDDGDSEEKTYLEHWEAGLILRHLAADAIDLVQVLLGTGLRWGEVSALQVRDFDHVGGRPVLRVSRTWKEDEEGKRFTGAPKSVRSRRTLVLTPYLASIVARACRGKRRRTDLLFTAVEGGAWLPATFRRLRWLPALEAARAEGMYKEPRLHDCRHTHAAWLIARNVPLPAISARLGHESIQTTIDEYGHLMAILDDDLVAAVAYSMDAALSPVVPDDVRQAVELERATVLTRV
ncbi:MULTISPECIES: tyrosine-type recombinase/integrase [Streptomycetaceae]|uniref:tyrosine-type recombinase/integrase n=1 Tax=Streptomycetaceae TaxID=2062 RepID=UPI0009A1B744|nr:site-specific integrase [Streptomyces sp. CB02056]